MKIGKIFLSSLATSILCTSFSYAAESSLGVVNFSKVLSESKYGKQEQEALEQMKGQMMSLMNDINKQLSEIEAKLTNPDVVDSLSPAAEEELKGKRQSLMEEGYRYEQQFSQMMNQAQMRLFQTMSNHINSASGAIADAKHLSYVFRDDVCFYYKPDADITSQVIAKMNTDFDKNNPAKETPAPASPPAPAKAETKASPPAAAKGATKAAPQASSSTPKKGA
jgi:outer membrane protein